jgi:hypothetical protein
MFSLEIEFIDLLIANKNEPNDLIGLLLIRKQLELSKHSKENSL